MASKVTLRQKELKGNKLSLYLDFWPPVTNLKTGKKTRREFLNKHIYAPIRHREKKTRTGKILIPVYSDSKILDDHCRLHNENTLKVAEEMQRQWENKLSKPEIYTPFERELYRKIENGKKNFVKYFEDQAEKRTGVNYKAWTAVLKYLQRYTKGTVIFADINDKFCEDFRADLLTGSSLKSKDVKLSVNSAAAYFNKFKAALRQAYKDGILANDINERVKSIKEEERLKEHLTLEELNRLARTECRHPLLKKAALFAAVTGLRFSDIQKLQWKDIQHSEENGYYLSIQQKKTKDPVTINIPDQAMGILGSPGDPSANVFEGLNYSAYENKHLYQWIGAAGITKNITFHSFRHTYATLHLSLGTDIYTLSKLLGHKSLKTTEVYANVISETKRDAAKRFDKNLNFNSGGDEL